MNATTCNQQFLSRLAVCSWSLQPTSPADLVKQMKAIGLNYVQLDLDPFRESPQLWGDAPALLADQGIKPVSGMFRTVGEDYTTLETIRLTGGIVPDATWAQNWANAQVTVKTAARLGLKYVMFHAGFLPHDPKDPSFDRLAGRLRQLARLFADQGISLCCETGQESAICLREFLESLDEPNLGINFDPANMILYNNGNPIEALRIVGRWVKGVHVKDALLTKTPGTWGDEVTVGTGHVNWSAFFCTLAQIQFPGWLCFEREAGNQRLQDICAGSQFVRQLLGGKACRPLTVVASMQAKAGKEAELRKTLLSLIEPSRKDTGCINYDLHQAVDNPSRFVFHENWTSKSDLDAHLAKPHLTAFLARVNDLLAEPPQITLLDRISD